MQLKELTSKGQFKLINVDGVILVACEDGWYRYQNEQLLKTVDSGFVNDKAPYSSYIEDAGMFASKPEYSHIFVLNGGDIYRFDPDDGSWEQMFALSGEIDCIMTENRYKYLIGTHSDGLWYTYYSYDMVDHTESPKAADLISDTKKIYSDRVEEHIKEYHKTDASTISYVNNRILTPRLGNIQQDWQETFETSDGFVVVNNDIVQTFKTSAQ